jgi:glycosyltransferase involved in cell wall biosynthesis
MLHWSGRTGAGDEVVWGLDGLDPVLAGECDLSACAAISPAAMQRLLSRKAVRSEAEFDRALAVLLRGAGAASAWCEGLWAPLDLARPGVSASEAGPGTTAERISVVLIITEASSDLSVFLSALSEQVATSRVELLLMTQGLAAPDLQRLVGEVEGWKPPTPIRVRRYALADLAPMYLRNTAVGLATGDVVVFADLRAALGGAHTVQTLADWAASGGVAAACPRMERDGVLLSGGLAMDEQAGEGASLRVDSDAALAGRLRTAAAPTPWVFAANRRRWLESGGLRPAATPALWTADFAAHGGPAGRTLLVGDLAVEWTGRTLPEGLGAAAPLTSTLQPHAGRAIRAGRSRESGTRPARTPTVAPAPLVAPRGLDDPRTPSGLNLLVFADAFGASQAIVFEHGLSQARRAGRVAVRLVEEAALGGDGRSLQLASADAAVEAQFASARPDLVVASRLGHPAIWAAVKRAAGRRGTPILFHIDDDLFDLPLSAGIERYRLARAPRRLATLEDVLQTADLVLATTPALAARLRGYAGHGRIYALHAGTAGSPRRSARPRENARVKIGYMGSASHDADLSMIVPALNAVAETLPFVDIELFGSIAKQPAADRIARVHARHAGVDGDYAGFKAKLAALAWDIGLAPLRPIPFNRLKTPTKWAEYAEAGAAVLASAVEPYAPMAAAGAALTVADDGWATALLRLARDARLRQDLTEQADALLEQRYGWSGLETEIEGAIVQVVSAGSVRAPAMAGI